MKLNYAFMRLPKQILHGAHFWPCRSALFIHDNHADVLPSGIFSVCRDYLKTGFVVAAKKAAEAVSLAGVWKRHGLRSVTFNFSPIGFHIRL